MIAVDAGFFYALVDRADAWHQRCVAQLPSAEAEGWITTWPALAEACYLLGRRFGPDRAADLMDDVAEGRILVWDVPLAMYGRFGALMRKYAALPMDLADATLVLLAEHLGHGRILTTDQRDFMTYRWKTRHPFVSVMADDLA